MASTCFTLLCSPGKTGLKMSKHRGLHSHRKGAAVNLAANKKGHGTFLLRISNQSWASKIPNRRRECHGKGCNKIRAL
jgi:hypothetical protein